MNGMIGFKRLLVVIFIIICFVSKPNVCAQYFKGGLIFGITGSQMDGDTLGGYNKFGITAGFFIRHDISNKFAIRSDYKYIMKGAATRLNSKDVTEGYSQTLHYVEVPVTCIYTISKRLECEAGLALAMLLYDSRVIYSDGSIEKSNMNKYDLSAVFGITYLYTESIHINLKLDYSTRVVSLNYPTNSTFISNSGQLNNVLVLALYYNFR
jgi:hypothetical protein